MRSSADIAQEPYFKERSVTTAMIAGKIKDLKKTKKIVGAAPTKQSPQRESGIIFHMMISYSIFLCQTNLIHSFQFFSSSKHSQTLQGRRKP